MATESTSDLDPDDSSVPPPPGNPPVVGQHAEAGKKKPASRRRTLLWSTRSPEDKFRAVLWTVVALLSLAVWFAAAPESQDWSAQMSVAEARKSVNESSASGAPQQQVVNGWFVADALPIISEQLAESHQAAASGRVPSLLFVFGLGACADLVGRSLLRRNPHGQAPRESERSPDRPGSVQ